MFIWPKMIWSIIDSVCQFLGGENFGNGPGQLNAYVVSFID